MKTEQAKSGTSATTYKVMEPHWWIPPNSTDDANRHQAITSTDPNSLIWKLSLPVHVKRASA